VRVGLRLGDGNGDGGGYWDGLRHVGGAWIILAICELL
jgi:hypothetical protein